MQGPHRCYSVNTQALCSSSLFLCPWLQRQLQKLFRLKTPGTLGCCGTGAGPAVTSILISHPSALGVMPSLVCDIDFIIIGVGPETPLYILEWELPIKYLQFTRVRIRVSIEDQEGTCTAYAAQRHIHEGILIRSLIRHLSTMGTTN